MKYIKNLLKSIFPIVIIYIVQYLIIFLLSVIYQLLGYENLNYFLNSYAPIIMIFIYILIIIYLLKKYKHPNNPIKKRFVIPLVTLGISISCFLNMLIFLITKKSSTMTISLIISIISSGIIGPILEEILFRYILLNDLKKFNNSNKAIIISSLIFALVHGNIINIIYAFILGIILNTIYHKYNNIIPSIIIHISANIISIFLTNFNIYILILSIINILISSAILLPRKNN